MSTTDGNIWSLGSPGAAGAETLDPSFGEKSNFHNSEYKILPLKQLYQNLVNKWRITGAKKTSNTHKTKEKTSINAGLVANAAS